jgi:hypothetical protein
MRVRRAVPIAGAFFTWDCTGSPQKDSERPPQSLSAGRRAVLVGTRYLCYELGIDPIEMGNTLAMLAEATERGLVRDGLTWGDADRMIELVEVTGRREGIGEVLARRERGRRALRRPSPRHVGELRYPSASRSRTRQFDPREESCE